MTGLSTGSVSKVPSMPLGFSGGGGGAWLRGPPTAS